MPKYVSSVVGHIEVKVGYLVYGVRSVKKGRGGPCHREEVSRGKDKIGWMSCWLRILWSGLIRDGWKNSTNCGIMVQVESCG